MKVVLLPQAHADLDDILDPAFAKVLKRLRLLERFPLLGAAMVRSPGIAARSSGSSGSCTA